MGTILAKQIGSHDNYAESWEVCDHGEDQLIDSPFFRIDKLLIHNEYLLPANSTCKVVTSLSGEGTMSTEETSYSLPVGKTYLIPATCDDLHFESESDTPNNILIASLAQKT